MLIVRSSLCGELSESRGEIEKVIDRRRGGKEWRFVALRHRRSEIYPIPLQGSFSRTEWIDHAAIASN